MIVDCQNVVCIRLGVFAIMVYRPPSNSSEDNNHLTQFTLNFSVDRKVTLIGYFHLPSINWSNTHPFQGDFEAFVDTSVSSGLSQWVTGSTFIRFGNILDYLVFSSAIYRIGDLNIHCPFPHCGHCPIVFLYWYRRQIEQITYR